MNNVLSGILVLLLFVVNALPIQAQIITDRPDQTESSSTVPEKTLQMESGILMSKTTGDEHDLNLIQIPTVLLRYGITQKFELRINSQIISVRNSLNKEKTTGMSDLEIGAKIQILRREQTNTEIAFLTHVIVPVGTKGLTLNQFGTINKISVSHSITPVIGIGYNLGYNYFGFGKGSFTYSLTSGFRLSKRVGLYVETYGDAIEFSKLIINFDGGLTYLVHDLLQLDVSYGMGINYKMNYLSAGLSWNFSLN